MKPRAGDVQNAEQPWSRHAAPAAALVYFLLAAVYFLPAFLPGSHIYGTDYLVGGYFFHEFISERFGQGVLPGWVPHVYGGLPLYANPGSTYHPVRFLADFLFPVSRIWPTFFVVHFGLAGLGMFLLGRELGARPWIAFVGGLGFQFTGLTMSWVLGGHEGRIIVATLTPLVFYLYHRGIRDGAVLPFAAAAAVIGSALLTFQIQSSYYLLLGTLLWAIFLLWHFGVHRDPVRLVRVLALGIGSVAVAFALAAVNFLPFQDYVEASPRGMAGGRGYEYSTSFSMPVEEIAALAVPELAGFLESYRGSNPFKLHVEYAGAVVLLLAALGFAFARRSRYWWFFLGLGLFGLTLSLGGNTPIYRLYYELLPGTKRFRAPAIAFFLVSFSLVAMATLALEAIARMREERAAARSPRSARAPEGALWLRTLAWTAGAVAVVGWLLGAVAVTREAAPGGVAPGGEAFRFALFATGGAFVLWRWGRGAMGSPAALALLSLLTVADLWMVDRRFFDTVPPPSEMFAPDDVANFLRAQPGRDRVWVLPFPPVYRGQPGNYLMRFDIDLAGGEHGNQLQRYNEFAGTGSGSYVDWHNFLESPTFLNAANVRYIVAGGEVQHPRLREVHRGSALVYENLDALPRAFLVPTVVEAREPDGALSIMRRPDFDPRRTAVISGGPAPRLPAGPLRGEARVVSYTPDRVVVRTRQDRAGLLVLADNHYRGWTATVDGVETPILRANHTFRGVTVAAGEHDVVFTFEPSDLRAGALISAIAAGFLALVLVTGGILGHRRRRMAPAG